MTRRTSVWTASVVVLVMAVGTAAHAQVYDIFDFDETAEGPWSDVDNTTLEVWQVPDDSVVLDGSPSSSEYGGFAGVPVNPGSPDGTIGNAWILSFAQAKGWDGEGDSSFDFWLAHDSEFLYVGVDVRDDEVRSNDENAAFWKDDAIEIIVDANNDRANVNTDTQAAIYNDHGGHNYVNYEGRFSRWNEDLEIQELGWANAVEWTWGEDGEIFGVGKETDTGWALEARFHKSQLYDGEIAEGQKIGFNIGMDDDDGADLEIQYWWANRARPLEFNDIALEDGETIADYPPEDYDWIIDANGRLTHGGTGEIIFRGLNGVFGDFNNNGLLDSPDIDDLTTKVALGTNPAEYDLNTDTLVNADDINVWIKDLYHSWVGDANLDGEFNSNDLVVVLASGKYEADSETVWSSGDFNGDGRSNSSDLVAALADGGYEAGLRPAAVAAVPEPASVCLMILGLLAFCHSRRSQ